ncbi:unnamed protein product, partial [marine sediment metagenome]
MAKLILDDKWLDVDFPNQPEYVFGDAGVSAFDPLYSTVYEETETVMSQNELREAAERQDERGGAEELVSRIYDQGREGSCVANASCQAHEMTQAKTYGPEHVCHLSAISLYKQIGRSPQSGATISGGLKGLSESGALPLDNEANRAKFGNQVMPNTGWSTRYPDGWKKTAKNFQCLETHVVRSVEGLLTALMRQHPVVVGRQGHS